MKKKYWTMAGVFVTLVLVAAGVLRGNEAESSFRLVRVERGAVEEVVSSTGRLQATETVEVGTQISGLIAEIYVDFNDRVSQGQLLARIDPTLLRNEVRSAEASLARSTAEMEQAERELTRSRQLHAEKVVTDSELDAAEYSHAVARASYASAQVNVERARRNLEFSEIRSPINGIVVERSVDVGQTVAASTSAPTLFVIAQDLAEMEILAAVDESDIGQITNGQTVRFTVQAHGEREFEGTVRQVRLQSSSTENVVSYSVVITVPNPGGTLLPGMTATVDFLVAAEEDVLRVPNAALRFQPPAELLAEMPERADSTSARSRPNGGPATAGTRPARRPGGVAAGTARSAAGNLSMGVLWVPGADGKVSPRRVQTGLTDGQYTTVRGEGIEEGMEIVSGVTSSGSTAAPANPFQGQTQQGPGGPRGPRFGGG